jgi:hypothetical protein
VPALLFLALVATYLLGVGGIVVLGTVLGDKETAADLEARLAVVRSLPVPESAPVDESPAPYFVRTGSLGPASALRLRAGAPKLIG